MSANFAAWDNGVRKSIQLRQLEKAVAVIEEALKDLDPKICRAN
jgi:hypothetical protein